MKKNLEKKNKSYLDKAGITCSVLCTIHCLTVPLLAYSSPVFAKFFKNEFIHLGLLTLLIPIVFIAFYQTYKRNRKKRPVVFGLIGATLLIAAILFEEANIPNLEEALTTSGSIALVIGHILNIRLMQNSNRPV